MRSKGKKTCGLTFQIGKEAGRAGLYLFVPGTGMWQFLSRQTGLCLLTWFEGDGRWFVPDPEEGEPECGHLPNARAALGMAILRIRRKES